MICPCSPVAAAAVATADGWMGWAGWKGGWGWNGLAASWFTPPPLPAVLGDVGVELVEPEAEVMEPHPRPGFVRLRSRTRGRRARVGLVVETARKAKKNS